MSEKSEPRPEIKVVVESKDTASKVILIALVIVLSGVLMALLTTEAGENILGSATDSSGNCGDGIDNDNDGKIDSDDDDEFGEPRSFATKVAVRKIAEDILNDIMTTW